MTRLVRPGYLLNQFPAEAPASGVPANAILDDAGGPILDDAGDYILED